MRIGTFRAGSGRHVLEAAAVVCGAGVTVTLASAEHGHVGATAQALPREEPGRTATTSVLAVPGHKDDIPAREMAAELATRLGVPVAVSAGMHVDDASREDIEVLLANARELTGQIAAFAEQDAERGAAFSGVASGAASTGAKRSTEQDAEYFSASPRAER